MRKTYDLPNFSEELIQRMNKAGLEAQRNSKNCISLHPLDSYMETYKRLYNFHIDFSNKQVDGMNISEYTSNYKRVNIWVKSDELRLILDIEKELTDLLASDKFLP